MKHILTTLIIATAITGCTADMTSSSPKTMTVTSAHSFTDTETRLRNELATRNLTLFTVVDHGAGAQSVGDDIGHSKLFIFGNPKAGTPIMQAEPTLGLELPMKILLSETDGSVYLHRTDIASRIRQYGVADQEPRLEKIDATLTAIMDEAAGP